MLHVVCDIYVDDSDDDDEEEDEVSSSSSSSSCDVEEECVSIQYFHLIH